MSKHRLIKALLRETVDCTPVWLMRQAGRYLPEYRELRAVAKSFLGLAKNPEYACEVTLQPLKRFDLDAAIIFSDILMIPDAMNLGLDFVTGEGPIFQRPITNARDIENLGIPDPEQDLGYVLEAIRLVKHELDGKTPVIGFCGSPWTVATYMLEGKSGKPFTQIQRLSQEDPKALHQLLGKLAQATQLHLNAQIAAGADVVMLFDTWGSLLNESGYREFSLPHIASIIDGLTREKNNITIPSIVFAKGCEHALPALAATGCQALGLDEKSDLGEVRDLVGDKVALQGNLNPEALYASDEDLIAQIQQALNQYGPGSGHVFNLGHGVRPDMDPEKVRLLIDAVHKLS